MNEEVKIEPNELGCDELCPECGSPTWIEEGRGWWCSNDKCFLHKDATWSPELNEARNIVGRISQYLDQGGIWNPELADHRKVSDLLIDCRAVINDLLVELEAKES